jgi:hypothetical protein
VSVVMLYPVNPASKALTGKALRQQFINSLTGAAVPEPLKDKPKVKAVADEVAELPQKMSATVLIDGDVIDIGERDSGLV